MVKKARTNARDSDTLSNGAQSYTILAPNMNLTIAPSIFSNLRFD